MKRSVRNGIAVAGMAGGLWFLGHAVANADEGQTASADNTTSTSSTSGSNDSTNVAKAENSNSTSVSTGDIYGGSGGSNSLSVNTGVSPGGGGITSNTASPSTSSSSSGGSGGGSSVSVKTGSVTATQQANGGSVSGSGNVSVSTSVSQSASASNHVTQSSSSSSSSDGKSWDGNKGGGQDSVSANDVVGGGGDWSHGSGNDSTNIAIAHNDNSTDVSTGDIYGGDGGTNSADINTGLIIEPVLEVVVPFSDNGSDGNYHHGSLDLMAATGAVWVRQEANGGDVSGSGNVNVNGNVHQSASASNDVTQTSSSSDNRKWWFGKGGNDSKNVAVAANDNYTDVSTGDIYGGDGGSNYLQVNTGLLEVFYPVWVGDLSANSFSDSQSGGGDYYKHHNRSIDVQVSTGDVSATQEANGGSVSDSGNVCVSDSTDQSASASNDVSQNSSSSDKWSKGGNDSKNIAISRNDNSTDVSTGDIYGGDGGYNSADINTGAIVFGGGLYGEFPSSLDVTTGDVTATQEANGGDVTGSGNVSVGNKGECGCQQASAPTPSPAPSQTPAAVETVKKTAVATTLSSAQPTSTLAVTGAETSAPLTAGLLALGAGAALTLAGRRRREAQD